MGAILRLLIYFGVRQGAKATLGHDTKGYHVFMLIFAGLIFLAVGWEVVGCVERSANHEAEVGIMSDATSSPTFPNR